MQCLVVVESRFGCTAQVANAIASGVRAAGWQVTVVTADDAPGGEGFDLVIVGAPTHNLGLPTPRSRQAALSRGGSTPTSGVAEWLAGHPSLTERTIAAFDTVVPGPWSGSAAKKITRAVVRLGGRVDGCRSFQVMGNPPALAAGQLDAAREWGAALVRPVRKP